MIKKILAKVLGLNITIIFTITSTLWAVPVDTAVIFQNHLRPSSVVVSAATPQMTAAMKDGPNSDPIPEPDVVIPERLEGEQYRIYNTQLDLAEGMLEQGKKVEARRILEQASILLEYHFFETEQPTFEAMRKFVQSAFSVEAVNIRRPIELESPPFTDPTGRAGPIDIMHMEKRRVDGLKRRGSEIPAAFGFGAGGLSTRSKGVMRAGFVFAIPELNLDNPDQLYGFVQLKIAEAKRSQAELKKATKDKDARVNVYIMGSYGSVKIIKEVLEKNDYYGYDPEDIKIFAQGIQIRFIPSEAILNRYLEKKEEEAREGEITKEELEALRKGITIQKKHVGEPLRLSDGRLVINPPGHWGYVRWLILSGILAELKRDKINFIMNAHMNNTAGRLSAELKGLLAEQIEEAREDDRPVPVALVGVAENRNERGGLLLTLIDKQTGKRKVVIADKNDMTEEFKRHVSELDRDQLRNNYPYFHTGSILFSVDGLMETFGLNENYDSLSIEGIAEKVVKKEPHAYISLKESNDIDGQGRPLTYVGAQIERNISGFTFNLPYIPVIIDRDTSFVPIKTLDETDPSTETGRRKLREAADALGDRLAYLFDDIEFADNVRRISNVASGLLRDEVSDKAFTENVSGPNRAVIRRFLLNKGNEKILQVILGIRAAGIQNKFHLRSIYNKKGRLTSFGRDFLYFLRTIGYKTGKKVNIKRIETPDGVIYYIYDEDTIRYHGYINGYPPDYLNLTSALEDFFIVSEAARGEGVFHRLATEEIPEYMKTTAEAALDESRRSIKEGAVEPRKRDVTLGPLWIPSYRRPMGLYRVLELQTRVLNEYGHNNIPIAVASNVDPEARAEAMKDPEVDWINKTYFNNGKKPEEIRAMEWGKLDRLVVKTFKEKGYNIVYIDWNARDAIVKKVVDTLTKHYTSLWGKLREDIKTQFEDIGSIRGHLERILDDQFASNISGIRNFTIMLAMGHRMVSVDDDSLPVMRVAKREVLEDILEKRRQEVRTMREKFFKDLSNATKRRITSESDFVAYLRDNRFLPGQATDVIRRYYAYSSPKEKKTTALIPEKAGQIVSFDIDTTTRFDDLLNTGLPQRIVVSEDAILVDVDNPEYQYDEYTVDYLGVLDRALGAFVVSPNTGAMIVDKDKRGFAGSVFTGNVDEIRFLKNQSATTHFNYDRDKSGDAQIDSFLKRGAINSLILQEATLKVLYLARPEGVTALLNPQEDISLSSRIFMCMNMFSFDGSIFPIPTIGQLLRIEEPYFNYLMRAVTGRLMTWSRTVGGHHRIMTATRPNIPLQVFKEHTAMTGWPVLNKVVRETLDKFEAMDKYDDRIDYKERMMYLGKRMIEEAKAYQIPEERRRALLILQSKITERINSLMKKAAEALRNGNKKLYDSLNMLAGEFVIEFLPPKTGIGKIAGTKKTKYPAETTYLMEVDKTGDFIRLKPVMVIEDMVGDVKQKEDRTVSFEINRSRKSYIVRRADIKSIKTTGADKRYSITLTDGTKILFDEMPKAGEKRYVSGINDSTKEAFIEKVVGDVRRQMKSDGETLLFWPDVIDVARTTEEFQQVTQGFERAKQASTTDTTTKSFPAEEAKGVEKLTLRSKMGERTFIITGPVHGSEKLLLAEDVESGELFVIKKLVEEEMEKEADEIDEFLWKVPEDYPNVYRPVIMNAGKGKWAGPLLEALAIVYPYVQGIPFGEKFQDISTGTMGYRGIELIDTVIKIADIASDLEKMGVSGVWDLKAGNILIRPDGSPLFIDYKHMGTYPVDELEYLIYRFFTRPGYKIEDIISNMRFVNAKDLNQLIQKKFLALHRKVKARDFSSVAEFKQELIEIKEFSARPVLKDLIRDWKNYDINKDIIRKLTLDILGIKGPSEFKPQRPVRVIIPVAGLGTRMKDDKSKVLQEVGGEPIICHVLKQTAFLDDKPLVIVRSEEWKDALGEEGKGGNYAEIKEALEQGGFNAEYAFEDYLKGDGYAVLSAKDILKDFDGDILIVWGDMAVLNPETVLWLTMIHQALGNIPLSIATTAKQRLYAPILEDEYERVIGSKKGVDLDFGRDDVGVFIGKAKDLFDALGKFPKITLSEAMGTYSRDAIETFISATFKNKSGEKMSYDEFMSLPGEQRERYLDMEIYLNPMDKSLNKKGEINFVQVAAILAQEGKEVIAPALADIREFQGVNDLEELKISERFRIQMMFERNSQKPADEAVIPVPRFDYDKIEMLQRQAVAALIATSA